MNIKYNLPLQRNHYKKKVVGGSFFPLPQGGHYLFIKKENNQKNPLQI
jgi:hypothetical protein